MLQIGVQTKYAVSKESPGEDFNLLKTSGFSCADFSLNEFLNNTDLYRGNFNHFFSQSVSSLEEFFKPYKEGAISAGIQINQMHMPYPVFIPTIKQEQNDFLWTQMAPKSVEICSFFECRYLVVHGLKLLRYLGSEDEEWKQTEKLIDSLASSVKEKEITLCVENLYNSVGEHIIEGPCCDVHKVCDRIDRINEKYGAEILGFCFDTGHANLVGLDFENFLTALGNRLKVLHIHDNDGVSDLHQLPFTFTRTRENKTSTDWAGFIKGLRNIHYDKVLSFETAPVIQSYPTEMKEDALKMIARTGEYFRQKIEGGS